MKVTLYMAVSIDGFIAKKDGDSDWVSEVDSVVFNQQIKEKSCIVLGRRTFEQYQGSLYPVKDVVNIVLTSDVMRTPHSDNVFFANSPKEALKLAVEKGHHQVLLIGGGRTNGSFLRENLIDEIYLSIHPLVLGEGIKLFEEVEKHIKLELLSQKDLGEGLIQLHYKVIR